MVVTLQPFLIQFTRFLSENHKKYIKNDLLSERNEDKNTIRRYIQKWNCHQKKRDRKLGLIGQGMV